MLEGIEKILTFTASLEDVDAFFADQKTFDAVLMNFVVIGEAVARLSTTLKEKHEDVPWRKIKQFRNIVAHNYFGIDAEEVWQIIGSDLPVLQSSIKKIFDTENR